MIKGVFKDHLVDWVSKYLEYCHGAASMERVLDEIDRRSLVYLLLMMYTYRFVGLHLRHHSQVYAGSNRAGILIDGPGMIPRL